MKQNEAQSARAKSTHKGVNQRLKDVTEAQQHQSYILKGTQTPPVDVPLADFMYLVFTSMPNESYRRQLRSSLLCLCDRFQALINSFVC